MDFQKLQQWINRIYRTAEQEIGCDQLQEFLPAYTDMTVQGTSFELPLADIRLHLLQCPDCADVYQALHRVAEFEAKDALPTAAVLLADLAPEPVRPTAEPPPRPATDRTKVLPIESAPLDLFPTNPG